MVSAGASLSQATAPVLLRSLLRSLLKPFLWPLLRNLQTPGSPTPTLSAVINHPAVYSGNGPAPFVLSITSLSRPTMPLATGPLDALKPLRTQRITQTAFQHNIKLHRSRKFLLSATHPPPFPTIPTPDHSNPRPFQPPTLPRRECQRALARVL
jgi:hypothetical protein